MGLKNICRTCLKIIQQPKHINKDIQKFLEQELKIAHLLNGPEYFCMECFDNLNNFNQFYCKIHAANEVLKKILQYSEEVEEEDLENYSNSSVNTERKTKIKLRNTRSRTKKTEEKNHKDFKRFNGSNSADDLSGEYEFYDETVNEIIQEDLNSSKLEENTKSSKRNKYKCKYCERKFSSPSDVLQHENIHTGIKPYTCEVCGKSFRQKNILVTHQTLHFGKKIECEVCGKKFARKSYLILHNRMHRNERPFQCDYENCTAAYPLKQGLIAHKQKHLGERSFKCEVCAKGFLNETTLRGHIAFVHCKFRFECDKCEKSYVRPKKLREHYMQRHKTIIDDVSHLKKGTAEVTKGL